MLARTKGGLGKKENIIISVTESLVLYELKQHKPWYDDESLRILDQRKEAKMRSNQCNLS
jgi:hypothetical protein